MSATKGQLARDPSCGREARAAHPLGARWACPARLPGRRRVRWASRALPGPSGGGALDARPPRCPHVLPSLQPTARRARAASRGAAARAGQAAVCLGGLAWCGGGGTVRCPREDPRGPWKARCCSAARAVLVPFFGALHSTAHGLAAGAVGPPARAARP